MKRIFIAAAVAASTLTACQQESPANAGQGQLSLSLTSEGTFTKAGSDEVSVSEFSVSILDAQGGVVKQWSRYADVPSMVTLETGDYTMKALSPGNLPVAFSQPVYAGEQEMTIEPGKVTDVDLVCSLSNMKVSVICTDRFLREMNADFTVTVTSRDGFLVFTRDVVEAGTAGYFAVAPLTVYITGTRVAGGQEVNHYFELNKVAARDHHILRIDAMETGDIDFGEGGSGITVDYTLNDRQEDIFIDGFEENPVDPEEPGTDPEEPGTDPEEPEQPQLSIEGDGITEPVNLTLAEAQAEIPPVVDITVFAEKGIAGLRVRIGSSNEEVIATLSGMGLLDFDFTALPAELEGLFVGLGILPEGEEVAGKTEFPFSVGGFMKFMGVGEHSFTVTVRDTEENEATAVVHVNIAE